MSDKPEVPRKDDMEICKNGCTYSRSMDQVYPRKCIWCGKVEAPKEKAESEVPSAEDYNLQRDIRTILKAYCNEESGKSRDSATAKMLELISALRASWEREKEELEDGKKSDKDEIVKMAEAICLQANENTRLRASLIDIQNRFDREREKRNKAEEDNLLLKAENAELKTNYETLLCQDCFQALREAKSKIDTLTCALAEAREALIKIRNDMPEDPELNSEIEQRHFNVADRAILSDPTGQRASEEMKAIRAIKEEADYLVRTYNGSIFASLRAKLEAHESRRKV